MGKGSSKGTVVHSVQADDGTVLCYMWNCDATATRWVDWERYGNKRFISTSYCDEHGGIDANDPSSRVRKVK